ncbi:MULTISPECIES: TetR/AcrR family transcriptional regulator [Nocardia]|jgi:AcrR family transcriptional regulator|uniref:TetR family transcriptional regulator n=2 Tax=Nocardia TaxID=1817 RepID=A0A2T2ZBY0_9NOCA|nr:MULTISPECIES: TetR/AcrR family transcriptional regulator [Nocardia]MDN2496791.1 TetR/AcrR family transcriptional regulator [Nocardia nova]PSR65259.1 TetR family transcriptional regulator [Nocardia nova]
MGRQATPLGRPRDPELDEKLMTAALLEYAQLGWGAFTMQGVARRAGVGKSALYLRWANKEQLLLDSVESVALTLRVNVDTGSLTGDLTALATALLEHFLDPIGWATLRITIDVTAEFTDLQPFQQRIVKALRAAATGAFTRAVERGEMATDTAHGPLIESLFGAVLMHTLACSPDERAHARTYPVEHVGPLVEVIARSARPTKK